MYAVVRTASTLVETNASFGSPGTPPSLPLPGRRTTAQLPTVMASCTLSSCRMLRSTGSDWPAMTISTPGWVPATVYLSVTSYPSRVTCWGTPGRRVTGSDEPLLTTTWMLFSLSGRDTNRPSSGSPACSWAVTPGSWESVGRRASQLSSRSGAVRVDRSTVPGPSGNAGMFGRPSRLSDRWSEALPSMYWNSAFSGTLPEVSKTTRMLVSTAPVSGQSAVRTTRPRSSWTGLSGAVAPNGAVRTRMARSSRSSLGALGALALSRAG